MSRPPPRKMLPLPDNDAPKTSRQVPPLPQDDNQPAPPLPGRRAPPPLPPTESEKDDEPEEVYDDGEIGEEPNDIYEDDVEVGPPEDVYDDGEILEEEEYHEPELDMPPPLPAPPKREPPPPPQSSRPPIRPPSPQDVYEVEPDPEPRRPQTIDDDEDDNIYEMEPEVRDEPERSPPQLPSRPAANPPQETYEIEEEQEEYDEFSVEQETYDEFDQGPAEVYEAVSDETPPSIPGRPMPPPPPAVPAPSKHTPPVPRSKSAGPKPTPKPPGGGGPMGIDLSAITNIKLKKVGVPADDRPKPTETDKIYSEEGGVKSAFEKFKQKDLQASGSLPFPKSAAAVATSLKKPITPGKPNLHVRPFKKQESENTDTKPPSPVSKAPPSVPIKPRSPSPARDAPPLPPPSKSIPDKPAPAPYSQVKPNTNVSNGTKLGVQEDQQSSGDEDDDIYDDAISNRDPLLGEPWYFKSLKDRKTGDKLLRKVGNDGTFLIRESTKQGHIQPYTMMVLFQNNIYNLKIRVRPDGKMALGEEKPDEMSFMDVQKLVKYHRETEVILVGNTGQHKTLLKCSPPQNAL